jgi:hypothetical protein
MQLDSARPSALRARLGAAASALLAVGAPMVAQADAGANWQVEASTLLYGERGRTSVTEPYLRVTRLFENGRSLSAKLGLDTITGASPTGAAPSGRVQTTTSASGRSTSTPIGSIPLKSFHDTRGSLDVDWTNPLTGHLSSTLGGHFSRETDYQSLGVNGKLSAELMQRLTTVTVGGGVNRDRILPIGGTPAGLSVVVPPAVAGPDGEGEDGRATAAGSEGKQVDSWMAGVSRVLTRRWMIGANVSRSYERGYLTEPYKVVSVLDQVSGLPLREIHEKRPSTRNRFDLLTNSVYHLSEDVAYLSHRYYRDDWGIRSNTYDAKYRHEVGDGHWVQPHLRYYSQTPADFFTFGLQDGAPAPDLASADYRLGPLKTFTMGATLGFPPPNDLPGEVTIRAEYIRQWGNGHPAKAIGIQSQFDLSPPVSIGTLVVGYSVEF